MLIKIKEGDVRGKVWEKQNLAPRKQHPFTLPCPPASHENHQDGAERGLDGKCSEGTWN